MRSIIKKSTAYIAAMAMFGASVISPLGALAEGEAENAELEIMTIAEDGSYSCDFKQLVKDGADTSYGQADDIIVLDEYTTANLTYEGTYVSADGKVYLKSSAATNGSNHANKGSYIAFTAPSNGALVATGSAIGCYEDNTYKTYGNKVEISNAAEGKTYYFGYRSGSTYIESLTFTPDTEPPVYDEVEEYVSPSTTWDFNEAGPAQEGYNKPVISGTAEYDTANKNIKFNAETTTSGALTVDFDKPLKNNVKIGFDVNMASLGQQNFVYSVKDAEGNELVYCTFDRYNQTGELRIGGNKITDASDFTGAISSKADDGMSSPATHFGIELDFYALKAKIDIGSKSYSASLPEETTRDIDIVQIESNRSKTAGRHIYVDNLAISEFESTADPAPAPKIADGYTEGEYNGMPYRILKPESAEKYPLIVYLHSSTRSGTDNASQLYQAQYLFNQLKDKAVLVAPQTTDAWSADNISGLIDSIADVDTDKVYLAGQGDGADAALAIAAVNPDKIAAVIAAAPTAELTGEQVSALSGANTTVYVFAQYGSANAARAIVNKLQSAKMTDVMYTEYPFAEANIAKKAAETTGITDWLLEKSMTDNASKKSEERVVDLVLFAGQSNMAGRGEYDEAIECLPGHGFEYHPVTEPGVLSTISEPFGKYENNSTMNDNGGNGLDRRSGDMVSSFMESYYKASGVPIVGVQASRGGQATDYFMGAAVMAEMVSRYKEAEQYLTDSGYTIGKKFLVWCQGETDADKNRSDDSYKSNTLSIFNSLKSGTGLTDMFMIRIGHCKTSGAAAIDEANDPNYKRINLAQKALADANSDITAVASFYTDEYAALMRDQYHYHQPAYNSVGTIAGNNTAYTIYNKGAWTEYPEPDEVISTPMPVEGAFEITSSAASVDVSTLKMYDNTTYRMYKPDGSYETVTAENGLVSNTTGGEVTIVPEYKFEFTNQTNPTDANIVGYVKVAQGSYTEEKGYGLTSANYSINENGCKADGNPIKVILADGFYDITVYRLGGGRADIYSKGQLIANNTTSATAQNRGGASALMEIPGVKLSDGSADITFGNLSGNNERIASIKIVRVPEKYRKPVIWIAGDSESSNYYPFDVNGNDLDSDKIMITGFGQQLSKVLSDKYSVSNYGQPSATVKTWYDECFESVNELMQPGDTILIDFGINEVASSSNKLTKEQMQEQMKLIIDAAKAKNVTPILISPVYNGKYQSKAYFTYNAGNETNDMYEFAKGMGIDCIDLNKWTQLYVNKAIEETKDANWVKNNYHVDDNLHMTQHSALLAASFIAAAMEELGYETLDYSYIYNDISDVLEGNLRGTETGEKRIYSVAAAKAFMSDGTILKPSDDPTPTPPPVSDKVTLSYDAETNTLTLTAPDDKVTSVVAIKASYTSTGVMDSVKIYPLTFANLTAEVKDIEITENDKVYVWDTIEGMKPLSDIFTLSE